MLQKVLSWLVEELTKPPSIIYHQSCSLWSDDGVSDDLRLANPSNMKCQKENPGNYRPVILTLVPSKVMEQIVLIAIILHVGHNQGASIKASTGLGKAGSA